MPLPSMQSTGCCRMDYNSTAQPPSTAVSSLSFLWAMQPAACCRLDYNSTAQPPSTAVSSLSFLWAIQPAAMPSEF
jgi:hypothetical protein